MEFEAVDEGTVAKILVPEGSEGVKVGAPIAILAGEGEDASKAAATAPKADTAAPAAPKAVPEPKPDATPKGSPPPQTAVENSGSAGSGCSALVRRGAHQGVPARPSPRAGAEYRLCRPFRAADPPGESSAPMWMPRSARLPASRSNGSTCRRGCGARHASRHAGADGAGDPARRGQAFEHPQDHRSPPDRGEAARSRTSI
jgi:pyruvate dehydrogenase E2 component (dihydrolipoamide acetyltransferase)